MEKVIEMPKGDIMFSIWDLGGQREYQHMLPIVCNEANVLLFMFDLTRKATLTSVKQWYQSARKNNKTAIPFLIGTKFDQFITQRDELIADVTRQVRTYILLLWAVQNTFYIVYVINFIRRVDSLKPWRSDSGYCIRYGTVCGRQ